MKKISLLKKLGFGLTVSSAILPMTFITTSCSQNGIVSRYITFNNIYEKRDQDNPLVGLSKKHFSNDEILLGSRSFNNGNYILFVGSNMFDDARTFLAGSEADTRTIDKWFTDCSRYSVLFNDVNNFPHENLEPGKLKHKFGFAFFLDSFNGHLFDKKGREYFLLEKAGHRESDIKTKIGPFDTWTKEMIDATKDYNELLWSEQGKDWKWNEKAVKEGGYIRQDSQAKAYRAFCRRGAAMFPVQKDPESNEGERDKTFATNANNTTCLMVIYRSGRLVEIADMPTVINNSKEPEKDTSSTTLLGAINKHFVDIEEEK